MKTYKVLQILSNTMVKSKNSSYLASGALTGVNIIICPRYRLTVETEDGKRKVFEVIDINDVIVGDVIYFEDNDNKYVKRITD